MRVKTLNVKIVQNVCLHINFVCGLWYKMVKAGC